MFGLLRPGVIFCAHHAADRANKAEMLDEFEEWEMINAHYCFAVAVNSTSTSGVSVDLSRLLLQ